MKNLKTIFAVSTMIIGMMLLPSVFGAAKVYGADYSGVYQCELQGDARLKAFINIDQTGPEALLQTSWDPGTLPGTVAGQTIRFDGNSIKLTLTFMADGAIFKGEWYREDQNETGTISGAKVDPSLWPLADFSTLPVLPDTDKDGLPDDMEQEYGTDATRADSDGDALTDYYELRKYHTNPLSADSDGDGKNDNVWEERREYTYTIQAIVDLRPPFDVQHMNDFYQDARLLEELGDDVSRVEVILYPEAQVVLNPSPYQRVRNAYTEPTYTKNYSSAMAEQIEHVVKGVQTDIQAIVSILDDFNTTSFVPEEFFVHRVYDDYRGNGEEGGTSKTDSLDELKKQTLFADSMYQLKTHGTCGSKSILRGAMLRAVGIPEKTIVTIPLLFTYETDKTKIVLKEQYQYNSILNIPSRNVRMVEHWFNEALIGSQWVRVDHKIDTGVIVPIRVGIKILEGHDVATSYRFSTYWNSENWREKRPYQYVSVIEQEAQYEVKQMLGIRMDF